MHQCSLFTGMYHVQSCHWDEPCAVFSLGCTSAQSFHWDLLLELQLILASEEDCVQLVPKYYSKVKLRSWQPPNILSEIMRLLQNGASGINLAQISNRPLWG